MKMTRQLLTILILTVFLFSCKEKEKQPATNSSPAKDTIPNVKADTSSNPYVMVDISPMDMSYYPADYPKMKMANNTAQPPVARVIYSRPHLQGRELFHDVLKYGEHWRLGANEATEIDFFS